MRFVLLVAMGWLVTACVQTEEAERERLKEELKREILAELAAERQPGKLEEERQERRASGTTRSLALPTGHVIGRVLLGERGLPGCKVRLIRLEGVEVPGILSAYRETAVFEALTGADGAYDFEGVPVGSYRIKWLPEGERGWIRRLSDRPEVVVEEGRTSTAPAFHAARPLLEG